MDWHSFLQEWEQRVLACLSSNDCHLALPLRAQACERKSLRYPPASNSDLADLEARIGAELPPSYRSFLLCCNGWLQIGMDAEDGRILAADEVDLLSKRNPVELQSWLAGRRLPDGTYPAVPDSEYFVYGPSQDCVALRDDYLMSAIAISQYVDSSVYLLVPKAVHQGEWEAWRFGASLPGAVRFRSFAELMEAERGRIWNDLGI